jgi:alkanesulfonate monooxygenase SsuD/methylene tetrahydromethanopterin reductase-like flavin-dependent oxidoreductase (luciferase family)
LGTFVVSPNFRHPVPFAREATALDDLCDGRLTLGIGAGGHGYDNVVLGQPELSADQKLNRFAEFLYVLDKLLREDRLTWRGQYYAATDARATPGPLQQPRPGFVVAANGRRSIQLALRYGQGWSTLGSGENMDEWWRSVADRSRRFDDALTEAGRPAGSLDRYLALDPAPEYALRSVDAFVDAVGRAGELGFTDVVANWPRDSSWYAGDEKVLEGVAGLLPRLRAA